MSRNLSRAALILAYCAVVQSQRVLRVVHPPGRVAAYDAMIARWMGLQSATVTFNVSHRADVGVCSAPGPGEVWCRPGRPALLSSDVGCSWETRAKHAQRAGCTIFISRTRYPEVGGVIGGPYQFDGSDVSPYSTMIIANTVEPDFQELTAGLAEARRAESDLTLHFNYAPSDFDDNPWIKMWRNPVFLACTWVILPVMTAVCTAETIRRLYFFLVDLSSFSSTLRRKGGYSPALMPSIVLAIELVGWTCRCIIACDFAFTTHVLPRNVHQSLTSTSFPFFLLSSTILILTWRDTLSKSRVIVPAVFRFKWYILSGFLTILVLEVSLIALRVTYTDLASFRADILAIGIYVVYQIIIGLFFTVYGTRVVIRLRALNAHMKKHEPRESRARSLSNSSHASTSNDSKSADDTHSARSSVSSHRKWSLSVQLPSRREVRVSIRMTMFLISSSLAMFASAVCWAGLALTLQRPSGLAIMYSLSAFFINVQAMTRVLVFPLPGERDEPKKVAVARASKAGTARSSTSSVGSVKRESQV